MGITATSAYIAKIELMVMMKAYLWLIKLTAITPYLPWKQLTNKNIHATKPSLAAYLIKDQPFASKERKQKQEA